MKLRTFKRIRAILLLIMIISSISMICRNKGDKVWEPYTVRSGDTLWDIGVNYADGDVRDWIYEVTRHNGISCSVYNGQTIEILVLNK